MKGTYGIFLIIVLVLVSGFIAYVGDILGRRLGRRRVTLFGLRPRHTAIFFSVIAGMAITLLTLIAAYALSENVRLGLLRVDEMREQRAELEAKVASSKRIIDSAQAQTRKAEDDRKRAEEQASQARLQVTEAASKLKATEAKLQATELEIQRVSSRLKESQTHLDSNRKQLAAIKIELNLQEQRLGKSNDKLLGSYQKQLKLQRQLDQLENDRAALDKEVQGLQQQSAALRQESEKLQADVTSLSAWVKAAAPALTQAVVYEVGQEAGRELIKSDQPIADIKQQLEQFIHKLDKTAKDAGVGVDESGNAILLSRMIQQRLYEESQVLEMLARQVHGLGGEVIVRAFSLVNVPKGQPMPIELTLTSNRLLFSKGLELSNITLDARKSEAELLIGIVSWLREKVGARAREANMLPDLVPAAERSLLFGGTRYPVGRISPERLLDILKKIKKHRAPVRVVARAAKDTWTMGPLELDLAVAKP